MTWIKCTERMPEEEEFVLVSDGEFQEVSYWYCPNNKTIHWATDFCMIPTHWMPLPEMPNELD